MKRKYDFLYAGILVILLVIAYFINNAIVKGAFLLLFSGVLFFNIISVLRTKGDSKFIVKFLLGILLFLDAILLLGSIYVLATAILEIV